MNCQRDTHAHPNNPKCDRQRSSHAGSLKLRRKRYESNEQPRPIENGMPVAEASQPFTDARAKKLLVNKGTRRQECIDGGNDTEKEDNQSQQPLHRTLALRDAIRAAKTGLYGSTADA